MKAQFEVDAALWRTIRLDAVTQGKTMGELVEPVLKKVWGGSGVKRGAPESKGVGAYELASEHKASKVGPVVKTSPAPVSAPQKATPCVSVGGVDSQLQARMIGGQPINEKVCVDCGKPMGSDPHYSCKKCREKQKDSGGS